MAVRIESPQVGSFTVTTTALHVHECPTCGIVHAFPEALHRHAREYNKAEYPRNYVTITCPAGHKWHYTGKNEEQRLRDSLDRERSRAGRLAAQRDQAQASARGHKAAATRARNQRDRIGARAKAGVCPCCNRTFKQLARHMANQHPEFDPAAES